MNSRSWKNTGAPRHVALAPTPYDLQALICQPFAVEAV